MKTVVRTAGTGVLCLLLLGSCAALAVARPSAAAPGAPVPGPLHLPSPDWRDQVIYFVMTDRFDDGNPANNDQGAGEFDRSRATHYQGGDLAGLRRRLGYIQGLGATAVWLTPPVANQWVDPSGAHTGYHGYWAEHFGRVDRHLGTEADYRALSRSLHGRGMYLVQDIVVNHTGDFFGYEGGWDPANPQRFYRRWPPAQPPRTDRPGAVLGRAASGGSKFGAHPRSVGGRRSSAATGEKTASFGIACCAQGSTLGLQDDSKGHSFFARFASTPSAAHAPRRPSQPPFHLNDPRRAADRRAGIYHWTPDVRDYADPVQEATFQMSGLDDLNTENPVVRRALRRHYGRWIRDAGVDAFRVDTAFYVPPAFFEDFLHARDPRAPGVARVAQATGREKFFVFGEGFGIDARGQDAQSRKIERWMTGEDQRSRLDGMLNFPLYGALGDVMARGQPTAVLADRIERMMKLHPRIHWMPSFVDNHDVDRFRAGASDAALQQALLAIFTLPGIPTVYYGTEQGFTEPRASMFAAGFGSGGRDRFDTGSAGYRVLAALSALRRSDPVFTRGKPTVLHRSEAGPGVLAWRMDSPGREPAFVVINTADSAVLLDKLPTGLPAGTHLQTRLSLPVAEDLPADGVVGPQGQLSLPLPARAARVWQVRAGAGPTVGGLREVPAPATTADQDDRAVASLSLSHDFTAADASTPVGGRADDAVAVQGRALAPGRVTLVVDGQLSSALSVQPDADGHWRARLELPGGAEPKAVREIVAWQEATGAVSPTLRLQAPVRWRLAAQAQDAAGDDHGPSGRYRYPTDPSYAAARTLDLLQAQAWVAGGALRLDLRMAGTSRSWSPANGFDHLALTVYIELPGEPGGQALMPLQHATLPEGWRWHRRLRVHGWSNALHAWEGASATHEGTPVAAAARVEVEPERSTIRLTVPPAAWAGRRSLAGARILVTTWDYDGGYRALAPEAAAHGFGGGDVGDPRVMDSLQLILPAEP